MKSISFFMARDDVFGVMRALEAEADLEYSLEGLFEEPATSTYPTVGAIPDIGCALVGDAMRERSYLVGLRGTGVTPLEIPQNEGAPRFAFDLRANPRCISFAPGGQYSAEYLIAGEIAIAGAAADAVALWKRASRHLRRSCTKIRAYLVGAEAAAFLDRGGRLVRTTSASRAYDLRR